MQAFHTFSAVVVEDTVPSFLLIYEDSLLHHFAYSPTAPCVTIVFLTPVFVIKNVG